MLNLADLQILIVDDDPFMRAMIKEILRSLAVGEVATADGGESGLDLVASFKPDVVLCDVEMSPMSGIQFLRKLRDHSDVELRATSVIMLTGHAGESVVTKARQLGATGYLVKPVSPKQLNARLGAAAAQKYRL